MGLNDIVFKRKKYYNDNQFENPQIVEDFLGREIEPIYNEIMVEIVKEMDLNEYTLENIVVWFYFSKIRSPYMRDSIGQIANFIHKSVAKLQKKDFTPQEETAIDNYTKALGKEAQIKTLTEVNRVKQNLQLYQDTINKKRWRILKSTPSLPFWTNDNPGFSPNTIERFAKDKPYHPIMELNENSVIIFPLSPKYCLELTPQNLYPTKNTTSSIMKVEYKQASLQQIEYINHGTFYTRNNLIIANSKDVLERYIKIK